MSTKTIPLNLAASLYGLSESDLHCLRGGNLFSDQIRNEAWLKEKQTRVLEQIRSLPRPADAYGLSHGDLHFGNFFVDAPTRKSH